MTQYNTLLHVFKSIITTEEIAGILDAQYKERESKWTGEDHLLFWLLSSAKEWQNYREAEDKLVYEPGMPAVDHTTLSKKANFIPYDILPVEIKSTLVHLLHESRKMLSLLEIDG